MSIVFNTSTTKIINTSVIIFDMQRSPSHEFIDWLLREMNNRQWSIRETGKRAGISYTSISNAANGDLPSFETCVALAKAFDEPILNVLGMAKLIDLPPDYSPTQAEWAQVFTNLSADDQQELMAIARLKLQKKRKADTAPLSRLKPKEAGV